MDILKLAQDNYDYAVKIRRHLHENPELTSFEFNTLELIKAELTNMGIEWVEVPDGGIVGLIHGGKLGKMVLMRADMDALPIQESKQNLVGEKVCVSKVPGISHACGHDMHTAMLLTEAKILNEIKDELNGDVVLCFERGEEGGGQVANLLPYIVEEMKLPIESCVASHVKWDVEAGQVSAEPGAVISGGYGFRIKLHGLAGHGSRPDLGHSVLDCFHSIYAHMNMNRMKYVSPTEILTFSIGKVNCGTALNIIPDELTFEGTTRTFNIEGAGEPFMNQFKAVLEAECKLHHCTYEVISMKDPLFECYNNEKCAEIAQNAIRKYIGEEAVAKAQPWMACESMQAYLKYWPGVITFTGIKNDAMGTGANHHTPEFEVDDKGMIAGITAAIGYVIEFQNYEGEIPFKKFNGTIRDLSSRNF